MFFDEVSVVFEGGRGGNGMVNFRREKFVPAGEPDGGNGGKGGDIILEADPNFNTLQHFVGAKYFKADDGLDGFKTNRAGREGEALVLKVPVGTQVFDMDEDRLLVDLNQLGQRVILCEGGRGGHGNGNFASSVRQAPQFAELGDIGEKKNIRLELQLVADVGLVGFPSVGKSTLISHVSAAKAKIGNYPFTTLVPNLGVVRMDAFGGSKNESFVLADMPGIIEGASEGKGLGDKFLKHIARSATLVFLLDPFCYDETSMADQYRILTKELAAHRPELLKKTFLVVMNKIDSIPEEDRLKLKKEFLKAFPKLKSVFRMASAVSGENLAALFFELWELVQKNKVKAPEISEDASRQLYVPIKMIDEQSFKVENIREVSAVDFPDRVHGQWINADVLPKRNLFVVQGRRIEQISRMTNTDQVEAIDRVYDVLIKMGIQRELRKKGAKNGDFLLIGPHVYEYHENV